MNDPDNLSFGMTICDVVAEAHKIAREKGWHQSLATQALSDGSEASAAALKEIAALRFGAWMGLIMSEAAEALEAFRSHGLSSWRGETGKPEGVASELADIVIRVGDVCGALQIDLEDAIMSKMEFNRSRSFRHGNKAV